MLGAFCYSSFLNGLTLCMTSQNYNQLFVETINEFSCGIINFEPRYTRPSTAASRKPHAVSYVVGKQDTIASKSDARLEKHAFHIDSAHDLGTPSATFHTQKTPSYAYLVRAITPTASHVEYIDDVSE